MAEHKYKFSTIADVARRGMGRLGWRGQTVHQLHELGSKPANWTVADQGNLQRVADALESIARELKRLREAAERANESSNESDGN